VDAARSDSVRHARGEPTGWDTNLAAFFAGLGRDVPVQWAVSRYVVEDRFVDFSDASIFHRERALLERPQIGNRVLQLSGRSHVDSLVESSLIDDGAHG
jgi:hypothetical protein